MFCPNCGNQIPDGYPFCSHCGTQFTNNYVNQQPQYQQPQYNQTQYQQSQYAYQPEYRTETAIAPRKSFNLMGVLAAVIALLVVGGIAAGIVIHRIRGGGPDKNPEKPDTGAQMQEQTDDKEEKEEHFSGWVVSAEWEYDQEGNLLRGRRYEYDIFGRLSKDWYMNKERTAYQYDDYTYDLNGNYTVTNCDADDDRVIIIQKFDANGERLLRIVYNSDGTESLHHECIFDEQDRLIAHDLMEKNGEVHVRKEYAYDEAGNQILEVFYEAGIEQGRVVSVYDENGKLIRQERIPNNEVDPYSDPDIYEYTYDERGNLIRLQHIFRDRPYDHEDYFYDDENRLVLMHRFIDHLDGWQEMSRFEAYNYNEQGQLILEGRGHSYDTSKGAPEYKSFVELTTYEYDAQGRVTVESRYGVGKISSPKHTEYREDGQIAHIRHTNAEGLLTGETIYTYDGSGNLLSKCYTEENNETAIPKPNFTLYEYTYDAHGNMTSEKYYYNRETMQYYYEYEYTFIP